jgi:hypothetical protein
MKLLPLFKGEVGRGFFAIPFAFDDYLELVDWAGRAVHPKKRGKNRGESSVFSGQLAVDSASQRIAEAMLLRGERAQPRLQELTEYLVDLGHDPNWRNRPSILDQLRGWINTGKTQTKRCTASPVGILGYI